MRRALWSAVAYAIVALSPARAGTLFAIGPDASTFVPDQLISVTTSPPGVSTITMLGDGSLAFNGGLTFGPGGALYGIANDSSGASSLFTIQPGGATSLIGSAGGLGFGFLGGLAYDSADATFYAAVNDNLGNTTLDSITPGGVSASTGLALGTGFSGLSYDAVNGLFYGIGNDNTGASTLYDFSLAGPVNTVAGLGFGFGALTYDAANDLFWAIDPVNNAGSQLVQISPTGVESIPLFTLGDGFAGLAAPPAPATQTPEPAAALTLGAGLVLIRVLLNRQKAQSKKHKRGKRR